ncbi:hypothetical protein WR25_05246 [Diploscapter pachys]|uniref:ZP domain-containing protein n=1 Tax=Diploscapter pachys TaxID=2018661 RepID=A0A2A2LQZ0_9BILA|nr:hypothetical protein WR25_05246 [Diploscapter pachys]
MSPAYSNVSDECTATFQPMQNISAFFNFTYCPPTSSAKRSLTSLLIVSRHSKLVTLNDTAYQVECQFSDGTVQAQLTVKPENFDFPASLQSTAELPHCEYSVDIGGDSKPSFIAPSASIGQTVVHNWQCGDASSLIFCMQVYNCTVDDGIRSNITLIDHRGCTLDESLLAPISYSTSSFSLRAFSSSKIFSFGSNQLIYRCNIRLTVKSPEKICPSIECVDIESSGEDPETLTPIMAVDKTLKTPTIDYTLSTNVTLPSKENGKH